MNTCVSDDFNVVNVQGIRYVSWGLLNSNVYHKPDAKYAVTVTYKGNNQSFYYSTLDAAQSFFNKIREAMDKNAPKVK